MQATALSIAGAFLFEPRVFPDPRGHFAETFKTDVFEQTVGHPLTVAQANASVSRAGTVRGIHFAQLPPSQAKYVTCAAGAVFDVVIDLRVGSPTYAQWDGAVLDDETRKAVYVPEGCGHAFMALCDDSVVTYLCSAPYAPAREHGLHPLDETIAIEWPSEHAGLQLSPLLSEKDEAAPRLADLEQSGVLTTYDDYQRWVATL
jgi:dTDP-4-dehydrorhamnose 3,5-epimerase